MKLKAGSLFSGYGGLDLAVESFFGAETAWHVEFDAAPSAILAARWPGVPNLGDVTKVDWSSVEPVDILTGGFPCQDLSQAGRQAGMRKGTRSGLWSDFVRAIDVLRPGVVVIENVRGLLSGCAESDLGPCAGCVGDGEHRPVLRALGRVLGDLAGLGFDAEWGSVRASDVGAPHGRFRVFVVAYSERIRREPGRFAGAVEAARGRASGDAAGRGGAPIGGLLPTPTTEPTTGNGHARNLGGEVGSLLPTPKATDENKGTPADADRHSPGLRAIEYLLPTPVGSDASGGAKELDRSRELDRSQFAPQLREIGQLLPTPTSALADGGSTSRSGDRIDELLLGEIARRATEGLLPTTTTADAEGSGGSRPEHVTLTDAVTGRRGLVKDAASGLLPTPRATRGGSATETMYGLGAERSDEGDAQGNVTVPDGAVDWGQYEGAVRRWEAVTRPAPAPTRPDGKNGGHRLNPEFAEWMMGLPAGWVTDPSIGISRREQLKACGNGVVPQQAHAALGALWARIMQAVS